MSELTAIDNSIISIGNSLVQVVPSTPVDPYNPLGLPPFTIRCKFKSGYIPEPHIYQWDSKILVDPTDNVWDITDHGTSWETLLSWQANLLEVLGANSSGVTSMKEMFSLCDSLNSVSLFDTRSCTDMCSMFFNCKSLTAIPLFDTSAVTNMNGMFCTCDTLASVPLFNTSSCTNMIQMFGYCYSLTSVPLFNTSSCTRMDHMFEYCYSLTSVPLFDTSSCTNMSNMFYYCRNVESGSLALYQQASSQSNPPTYHDDCFTNCGSNTVTGAAELAQIPTSWGGTGA